MLFFLFVIVVRYGCCRWRTDKSRWEYRRWFVNAMCLVWCLVREEVGQSFVFIMFLHTDSRHKRFFGFTIAVEFKSWNVKIRSVTNDTVHECVWSFLFVFLFRWTDQVRYAMFLSVKKIIFMEVFGINCYSGKLQ